MNINIKMDKKYCSYGGIECPFRTNKYREVPPKSIEYDCSIEVEQYCILYKCKLKLIDKRQVLRCSECLSEEKKQLHQKAGKKISIDPTSRTWLSENNE